MKYICTADLHFTHLRPKHRIDNYMETSLKKLQWIVLTANKYGATLLIAGDIFDGIKVPSLLVNKVIDILSKCKNGVLSVAGQHDMEYKSLDLEPSPYYTLQKASVITHIGSKDKIKGISWGEKNKRNGEAILLIHATITPKEPPFFLEDQAVSATDALRKYQGYRYIVSGDYHTPFVKKIKGRALINCGPMLRSNKDQVDFRPRVYLLDTDQDLIKPLYIPIEVSDKVFNIPKEVEVDNAFSEKMKEFILKLSKSEERPDYPTVVKMIVKETDSTKRVRDLSEKYIRQAGNE